MVLLLLMVAGFVSGRDFRACKRDYWRFILLCCWVIQIQLAQNEGSIQASFLKRCSGELNPASCRKSLTSGL